MKKKLEKHVIDIATDIKDKALSDAYLYTDGERYFVTDLNRILEIKEKIDQFKTCTNFVQSMKTFMDSDTDRQLDYQLHELPTITEIKDGIKELVGRKLNRVIWSDGIITVNARYLAKAMESLNAKVCYISKTGSDKAGIFLYENDNLQSNIKELILQIHSDKSKGFWVG